MPIQKSEIKDYYSSAGNSEGGSITSNVIPIDELAQAVSAGSTQITLYNASGFAVNDEIVINDGTNKEKRTINAINSNTLTLNTALSNSYEVGTPVTKLGALLPNITAQEAGSGVTKYKKFFKKNNNSSLDWEDVVVWISKQPTNAAVSIGLGLNDTNDTDANQGNMSALSQNSQIAVVSDGSDTRQVTIKGLNASGTLTIETLTLNGTTEVLSTNTFSKVYLVYASALNSSRTITIKQGSGGSTRGTIGPNKICCWLWFGKRYVEGSLTNAEGGDIPSEENALIIGTISAGASQGIWVRLMVPAGAGAVSLNDNILNFKGRSA